MICCTMRSSSIGTLEFCEMKFALTYNFGMKDKNNKKAMLGTIVHRAMQVLGDKSIAKRDKKRKVINDDIPSYTLAQCDDLDKVTEDCFNYYVPTVPELEFDHKDLKTCQEWVKKAVEHDGGNLDPRNQNVFVTEKYFEIELDKPWAKYSYEIGDAKFEGHLVLRGTVDLIIKEKDDFFQVLDYKGLPVETPIPTPAGWTTMGELRVGDIVFDQYGKYTKVIGKSSRKNKECYKIVFDDTSEVVCDDEHIWRLLNGEDVSIKDLKVGDCIRVASPIECGTKPLPIDPYVLGVWLGDGRNRGGEISSADHFVFEEIQKRGYSIGEDISCGDEKCKSRTVYNLTKELRKLNLLHNKHIPEIYLRASYDQRLDLLKGIMDSDGSVNTTRKQCVFMNCNKRLSSDVKSLLLTLGQRPLLSQTIACGFGLEVDAFPVSFRPMDIIPFNLPCKKEKVDPNWGHGLSYRRLVKSIEKIGKKTTQCIEVDSVDKTYLCTENFIPTHNTGKRLNWATGEEKTQEKLEKDFQLLFYYYALRNLYPDHKFYVSIYYINDGGVFDIVFDDYDYAKAETLIKQKFQYINSVEVPRLLSNNNSNWKCKHLCAYSKLEDNGLSICQNMQKKIKEFGYNDTLYMNGDLTKINAYGSGGGRIG